MHSMPLLLILMIGPLTSCRTSDAPQVTGKIHLTTAAEARLAVTAEWEPIKESGYGLHKSWEELSDFRPAAKTKTYDGNDFKAFLPDCPVEVGDIWKLPAEGLLKFLRQFHPGATLDLHINNGDSPGAFACLRAYDQNFADILFRIHAEFVLKEGFFTPGQMAGRLILNRATGEMVFFRMYLPLASINFDVNHRVFGSGKIDGKEVEREFMASAGGFAPRMELIGGKQEFGNRLQWRKQKAEAEMNAALAQQFYRFKRIQWIEFGRAAALARTTGKPLHVISLEGTLDDESC